MERAFATFSFDSVLQPVRTDGASFCFCANFCGFLRGGSVGFFPFRERITGLQTGLRTLSQRSMHVCGVVLSVCLAFAACKKNPRVVAPAAQETAKATPTPSATPVAQPINLK